MVGILKRIKYALLWDKAQQLAATHKYRESLDIIEIIFSIFGSPGPSRKIPIRVNLLAGIVYCNIGRARDAASAAEAALILLNSSDSKLDYQDALYLKCFSVEIISHARSVANQNLLPNLDVSGIDARHLDPTQVRPYLQRVFPLQGFLA